MEGDRFEGEDRFARLTHWLNISLNRCEEGLVPELTGGINVDRNPETIHFAIDVADKAAVGHVLTCADTDNVTDRSDAGARVIAQGRVAVLVL